MNIKYFIPFFILASLFLLLKITSLGIRMSDTNVYFYTAYQLLEGKILYRDIFFTNFPLFPYISSIYLLIIGKSLSLYYLTAAIEAVATSFILYLIILRQYKSSLLSAQCSSLYLFSFLLLATTDHQTGVFLASFFAIISYYFYTGKKFLLTGIFITLALLTKAYFIPIFLTYVVVIFWDSWKRGGETEKTHVISRSHATRNLTGISHFVRNDIIKFILGFTITITIVLLPTLIFAPNDFLRDVFQYSLTRSQGLSKLNILRFFVFHDLLIITSIFYSLIMLRKYLFFGVLGIFSLVFILLYQDIYYLYLNFLLPFFCLAFINLTVELEKRFSMQNLVIPTIVGIVLFINLGIYMSSYRDLQKIQNITAMTNAIEQQNPPSIYGENSLTPALAYLTDTPMVNTQVDTNSNIFRKGFLDAKTLTKQAIQNKSLMVAQGLDYPEYGARQDVTDEIFDITQMKDCRIVYAHPVRTEGIQNRINLITCN